MRRTVQLLAGALLALTLVACGDDDGEDADAGADVEDLADPAPDVIGDNTPDPEFFEDHESYVGETVTVSGDVTEVTGENAFRIAGDEVAGDGVLVLDAEAAPDGLAEGATVEVTGTVRRVDLTTFERDFGYPPDDVDHPYVGESAIAASEVRVLEDAGS